MPSCWLAHEAGGLGWRGERTAVLRSRDGVLAWWKGTEGRWLTVESCFLSPRPRASSAEAQQQGDGTLSASVLATLILATPGFVLAQGAFRTKTSSFSPRQSSYGLIPASFTGARKFLPRNLTRVPHTAINNRHSSENRAIKRILPCFTSVHCWSRDVTLGSMLLGRRAPS